MRATLSHKGRGEESRIARVTEHYTPPLPSRLLGSSDGTIGRDMLCSGGGTAGFHSPAASWGSAMSLGMILVIILIIFLLGGFSGRFGGYGYGMGHSGMGLGGVILVVLLILLLLGKL